MLYDSHMPLFSIHPKEKVMLKAGTQTGSLINHLQSRMVKGQPVPEVGMGATLLGWTDRSPATIIKVEEAGKFLYITVRSDFARVVSGSAHDGSAEYEYSPNPEGYEQIFRIKEGGTWEKVVRNLDTGRWVKREGGIFIGKRERYYDPSF